MGAEQQTLGGGGRPLGRYLLYDAIATGGMATVHIGRLVGPVGFSRTVAIKKLHPQFANDADFVAMFLDEARIAARIRHPNVVATIDVVSENEELFLVMDYVQGESLSRLVKKSVARRELPPPPIIAWIIAGVLHGLHAAHEARSEQGEPLNIVHRDVSPQNILVGVDGTPRILDFGVAKAAERSQTTRAGQLKGKLAYMSPEQLTSDQVDRRTDIYAMGVVLWEALTGLRLFDGATEGRVYHLILSSAVRPPSELVPNLPRVFDEIVLKALARNPQERYQTARDMALALESSTQLATPSAVGAWVESLAREEIKLRAERIADIESRSDVFAAMPPTPGSGIARRSAPKIDPSPMMNVMPTTPQPFAPPMSSPDLSAHLPQAPTSNAALPAPQAPTSNAALPARQAPVSQPQPSPSAQWPAATSSAQLPSVDPDVTELPFAPNIKMKRRVMIGAVVLGFAALIAIFVALISTLTMRPAVTVPVATVTTTAAPTTAPSPTVTAAPPPTTPKNIAPAADTQVMTMPSATVTPKKNAPAPVFVAPAVNCNPPFTIDKQGIKHPKPECL